MNNQLLEITDSVREILMDALKRKMSAHERIDKRLLWELDLIKHLPSGHPRHTALMTKMAVNTAKMDAVEGLAAQLA